MLADTIGTVVFGILYLSVVLGEKMSSGQPLEELLTPTQIAIADGLGLLFSGVGGLVAGRLARIEEVHHGAAAGFASLMVGIFMDLSLPAAGSRTWREVLVALAVVPMAALGGYVAARLNARKPPPLP